MVRVKRPRLPKKRSPALLQLLKEKAENLPCFSSSNGVCYQCPTSAAIVSALFQHSLSVSYFLISFQGTFLWGREWNFCDVGALGILRLRYRRQPKVLHLECYKLLIPDELLRTDGISATGKRGCVTFPARLNETITSKSILYV